MGTSEWAIIVATLFGPVLAVQAQKWIERARERRAMKNRVFGTLMATRAARLAPNHVQALNSIELAYYGLRMPGGRRYQTKGESKVLERWREYFDHLSTPMPAADEAARAVWLAQSDALFINLLQALADEARYAIGRPQLSKGHYSPVAHGTIEFEQAAIRQLALRVLAGQNSIRVDAHVLQSDPPAALPPTNPA